MDYQTAPNTPLTPNYYPDDYDPALNGVGGWLVLIIIGRILTIILGIKDIADLSALLGAVPSLDGLINASIICDIANNIVLSIVILCMMFARKIVFRPLIVIQVVAAILFVIISNGIIGGQGYQTTYSGLVSPIIGGAIWIAYLYKSKRVKNTYIYPSQDFGPTTL